MWGWACESKIASLVVGGDEYKFHKTKSHDIVLVFEGTLFEVNINEALLIHENFLLILLRIFFNTYYLFWKKLLEKKRNYVEIIFEKEI